VASVISACKTNVLLRRMAAPRGGSEGPCHRAGLRRSQLPRSLRPGSRRGARGKRQRGSTPLPWAGVRRRAGGCAGWESGWSLPFLALCGCEVLLPRLCPGAAAQPRAGLQAERTGAGCKVSCRSRERIIQEKRRLFPLHGLPNCYGLQMLFLQVSRAKANVQSAPSSPRSSFSLGFTWCYNDPINLRRLQILIN